MAKAMVVRRTKTSLLPHLAPMSDLEIGLVPTAMACSLLGGNSVVSVKFPSPVRRHHTATLGGKGKGKANTKLLHSLIGVTKAQGSSGAKIGPVPRAPATTLPSDKNAFDAERPREWLHQ